jgi:hypothetical protein
MRDFDSRCAQTVPLTARAITIVPIAAQRRLRSTPPMAKLLS